MTFARPLSLLALAAGALVFGTLAACGSAKSGGPPAGDAGSDTATADGAAETGPTTTGAGALLFTEAPDAGGTFFAGFSETAPAVAPGCTRVDAGPCLTTSCPPAMASEAGASDAASTPDPSAGTMTVTGGAFGAKGVAFAPDNGGTYYYASPAAIFAPGDTLGASATGGAVPAFPEQTVTATPIMVLTAPAPGTGGKITIPTAQPLTVSWTGGQAGAKAVLVATAIFTSGAVASTTCSWDASLGTGMAPSAALKPLAAANAETSGIQWFQSADRQFTVGTLAVTMSARVLQGSLASFE